MAAGTGGMAEGVPLEEVGPLPEGVRLFHIGPPKTGTTALQWVGAELRPQLLGAGVRYPGRTRNHRLAVAAFVGRPSGWTGPGRGRSGAPSMRHWYELLGELDADRVRRSWFGHEYAAQAPDDLVRAFAEHLGPSLHVVITLRSFARMLPSMWQEQLKAGGGRGAFEPWLRSMLRPQRPVDHRRVARHDHVALVQRWAGVLGTDRVTVVVPDRADRTFLFDAFEELLGLPRGLLSTVQAPAGINRSLSAAEAELLRRLNSITRQNGLAWSSHERMVVQGAVARLLASPPIDAAVSLPGWAVPLANEVAVRTAMGIAETGVRVVGRLGDLAEPAPDSGPGVPGERDVVPTEAAVAAVAGILAVATGHGPDFVRDPDRLASAVLTHARGDLRALAEVGVGRFARAAASRAAGGARGLQYATRGWLSARRHGE